MGRLCRRVPANYDLTQQPDKPCSRCGLGPPYVRFHRMGGRWSSMCAVCRNLRQRRRRAAEDVRSAAHRAAEKRYNKGAKGRERAKRYRRTLRGQLVATIGSLRWAAKKHPSLTVRASAARRLALYTAELTRHDERTKAPTPTPTGTRRAAS